MSARPKIQAIANGFAAPGFELVKETFQKNLTEGLEPGATFAAFYQGHPVVHVWGGYADKEARRLWKSDTLGCLFSTAKSASSIVIAHLVDRGALSYEDKVCKYWPEFAAHGKGDVTLEQLISNKAGLSALDERYYLSWMRDDPKRLDNLLAVQMPLWPPGSAHGYHPNTFALYLDAIVRRVDKNQRSLAQYFTDEIARPFDLDYFIGLPKPYQWRASRMTMVMDMKEYMGKVVQNFKGDADLYRKALTNVLDWSTTACIEDPDFMELPCGSSHGFGTSLAVAKLQGILANGGSHGGRQLLSQTAIQRFQRPLSWGRDLTYGMEDMYSVGTMLIPVREGGEVNYMFGHSGLGGQLAMSDCRYQVGWAYVTNHLDLLSSLEGTPRQEALYRALYQCLHRLQGVSFPRKTYRSSLAFLAENGSKL